MKPELFHIGNFIIHGYGFMIGIGFILAIFVGEIRARIMKLNDEAIIDIALIGGVSGFIGAKLLFVIVNFKAFLKAPLEVLGSAGFVVYGGIIFGVFFGWLYTRIKKLNFFEYFDLVMPEIALAQGFGRLGCFLAGCCYGRETDSVISVVFPSGSMAPAGVRLIPTQLISAAGDFINFAVLLVVAHIFGYTMCKLRAKSKDGAVRAKASKRRHLFAGDIGSLYMIMYGVGRFFIEFLRNDHRGEVGIFSTSQFISLIVVAVGIGLMLLVRRLNWTNR